MFCFSVNRKFTQILAKLFAIQYSNLQCTDFYCTVEKLQFETRQIQKILFKNSNLREF